MGPFLCEKHGEQFMTMTSPKIAKNLQSGQDFGRCKICRLTIESYERKHVYWVDEEFLRSFIEKSANANVVLKDRSVKGKKLWDRILIRKIIKAMVYICPKCLEDFMLDNNMVRVGED